MTSRAEREVMGLMLTTNAELVASVLRGGEDSEDDSVVAAIATTRSLGRIVEDTLHALVQQARAEGHTWAEIGELLHVTRQAAFQRFGTTSSPDTVPAEDIPPLDGAEDRARRLLAAFVERRFEEVRAEFSAVCARRARPSCSSRPARRWSGGTEPSWSSARLGRRCVTATPSLMCRSPSSGATSWGDAPSTLTAKSPGSSSLSPMRCNGRWLLERLRSAAERRRPSPP